MSSEVQDKEEFWPCLFLGKGERVGYWKYTGGSVHSMHHRGLIFVSKSSLFVHFSSWVRIIILTAGLSPFFFFFFWHGSFLKALLNLLQYYFCFMFCFYGHRACGILAPQPGLEPIPSSALDGEVLTIGPLGKYPGLNLDYPVPIFLPKRPFPSYPWVLFNKCSLRGQTVNI